MTYVQKDSQTNQPSLQKTKLVSKNRLSRVVKYGGKIYLGPGFQFFCVTFMTMIIFGISYIIQGVQNVQVFAGGPAKLLTALDTLNPDVGGYRQGGVY